VLPRLLVDGDFDRNLAAERPLTVSRCGLFGGEASSFAELIVATTIVVNDRTHHRAGIYHLRLQRPDDEQAKQQEAAQG